jgi:peptide/nickel transport system ATP-binding protein
MNPSGAPVLAIRDLRLEIAGQAVVDGLSLDVGEREVVALVGESGCGKSLTAFAAMRLLAPAIRVAGGEIRVGGEDVLRLSERAMRAVRGEKLSIIFQEPTASLDPLRTVGSQIAEAVLAHEKVPKREAMARAKAMLDSVGIADAERRLAQYPFELSGGMCQRVMIAIALIRGPKLLIADEPTTALDVTIQAQILDLMKKLVATRGASILLITHDMGVVAAMADRVAVMYAGRIVEAGRAGQIFNEPAHPYTALLLASVPCLTGAPKSDLPTIEGTVPTPAEFPKGCRFSTRCPLVEDRCRRETPPLAAGPDGHTVACWRSGEVPGFRLTLAKESRP